MSGKFNIIIYTENNVGLIVRITTMFLRRRIHLESLHVTVSELPGIYRFALVINETDETTRKIMLQIDKQVEVFKSFYSTDPALVMQEEQSFVLDMLAQEAPATSKQLLETV